MLQKRLLHSSMSFLSRTNGVGYSYSLNPVSLRWKASHFLTLRSFSYYWGGKFKQNVNWDNLIGVISQTGQRHVQNEDRFAVSFVFFFFKYLTFCN